MHFRSLHSLSLLLFFMKFVFSALLCLAECYIFFKAQVKYHHLSRENELCTLLWPHSWVYNSLQHSSNHVQPCLAPLKKPCLIKIAQALEHSLNSSTATFSSVHYRYRFFIYAMGIIMVLLLYKKLSMDIMFVFHSYWLHYDVHKVSLILASLYLSRSRTEASI